MRIKMTYLTGLLVSGAAGLAIAAAPIAAAAPEAMPCTNTGDATACQTAGNAQITANAPEGMDPGTPFFGATYGPFFTYDRGR